jgi:hypothetical protein
MGFRGAVKSGGGGFLNNVDGKITDYIFSDVGPGSDTKGDWIYFVPEFQVDGSDNVVSQHLFFGGKDRYSISKDKKTLTSVDGGPITFNTEGKKGFIGGPYFLISLLDNGLDEAELPDLEGGEPLNLENLIGYRVRFKQVEDEKATASQGPRVYKNKDGKEVKTPRTVVGVSAVYGKEGGAAKGASTKPTLAKGSKATATVVRDKADAAMLKLIAAKGGTLRVAQISSGIIQQLIGDTDKDAVRALAKSDEYLNDATERDVLVYDEAAATVQAA